MKKKRSLGLNDSNSPAMYSVSISKKDSDIPESMFNILVGRFFGASNPVSDDNKTVKYGLYTRDVAETKIHEISDFTAGSECMNLKCVVEKQISDVDQN